MSTTVALPAIGIFTPNGAFIRAATIADLRSARPIVYVRGRRRVCSDCATKDGNRFDRKPASHKTIEFCTACGQPVTLY